MPLSPAEQAEKDKTLHPSNCVCMYCTRERMPTTHTQVINKLAEAQKLFKEIHSLALTANALCAAIPVFMEIEKLSKDMSRLMQEVNKLRGL